MSIGCCDACDAQNVPGSHCGSDACTDGFFCFLCQGDEFDPYCEIEIDCTMCDGAGCHICQRTGKLYVVTEPVTLNDLNEIDSAQCAVNAFISELPALVSIVLFISAVAVWAAIGSGA
jgi:hypothetical protein